MPVQRNVVERTIEQVLNIDVWIGPSELDELPADAVQAPWGPEQIYQLNRRQEDDRVTSYRCPRCDTDLYATCSGWICARNHCRFRQSWALDRHVNRPFIPPPRREGSW